MSESRKEIRGQTNDYFTVYSRETGEPLGRLRNLTSEGAMVISENAVPTNEVIRCKMHLPDIIEGCREIRFEAECRWCEENKSAYWYEIGVKFVNLSKLSQKVIDRLVSDWMVYDQGIRTNAKIRPQ